jgi:hypothetical protein
MKTNKVNDERLQKNLEKNAASVYPTLLILTIIVLIVKIALKLHPLLYLFEIIALIASISYYTATTAWKNVLFVKIADEAVTNIRNIAKSNSYMLHSVIVLVGQMVFVLIIFYCFYHWIPEEQMPFAILGWLIYLFICGLPLSIVGSKMRKKEPLVLWNSEESKTRMLKSFKRACILYIILNGVFQGAFYLFSSVSRSYSIFMFVSLDCIFILMFVIIRRNLLLDEKKANKMVELAEKTIEEADGHEE